MSTAPPRFVFMTCRAGAESALKQEVARTDPNWRPAFSRPGLVTFKLAEGESPGAAQLAARQWAFAHAHGISLGRGTEDSLSLLTEQFWASVSEAPEVEAFGDMHVWQREAASPSHAANSTMVTPLAGEIEQALRASAPASAKKLRQAASTTSGAKRRASPRNSLVLDVVLIDPGEWWTGYHYVNSIVQRWPGGAIPIRMAPGAVSRAFLKMEEAIQWSAFPLSRDDEIVEIGCAPGGASQALLQRGLFVTGIDPAEVAPVVLEHPRFRHVKKRGIEVRRKEFARTRWLTADMNVDPNATLATVEAIVCHTGVSIRGMILTLKLGGWDDAARIPEWIERVRGWGYRDVRVRQLVSGGTEVCLAALRRKALRRLGRGASRSSDKRAAQRKDQAHGALPGPHF